MAAFARGKMILQDSFSVMGNSPKSFGLPYQVQRSVLIRQQSRPLTTIAKPMNGLVSPYGLVSTTRILPNLEITSSSQEFASKVSLPKEVDPSKIKFGEIKKNPKGALFVNLNYENEGERLIIQTPVLRIPFKVERKIDETNTNPEAQNQLNFVVSLDNMEHDAQVRGFTEMVRAVDEQVKKYALKNASTFFPGKTPSPDVVNFQYRSAIKEPKDPKWAPVMRFKIYNRSGKPAVSVTEGQEQLEIDSLSQNTKVMCLITPSSVWFIGGQFGLTWTLSNCRIIEHGEASFRHQFREDV